MLSTEHLLLSRNLANMVEITSTTSPIIASICKVFTSNFQCSIYFRLIEVLVDYKKQFLDLEIGWPGSVEDC